MLPYESFLAMKYSLPKSERLHAEKSIKELFEKGSSFFLYPFKIVFWVGEGLEESPNQVLFFSFQEEDQKSDGKELHQAQVERSVPIE